MTADILGDRDHLKQLSKIVMVIVLSITACVLRITRAAPAPLEPADNAAPPNPSILALLANSLAPLWNLANRLRNVANVAVNVACFLVTGGVSFYAGAEVSKMLPALVSQHDEKHLFVVVLAASFGFAVTFFYFLHKRTTPALDGHAVVANNYNPFGTFWNLVQAANAIVNVTCFFITLGISLYAGAWAYLKMLPDTNDSKWKPLATILLETTGSNFRSLLGISWLFEFLVVFYLNKVCVIFGLRGLATRLQEVLAAASPLLLQLGVVSLVGFLARLYVELDGVEEQGLKWMLTLEYIWNDLRWGRQILSFLVIAMLLYLGADEYDPDDDEFDEDTDDDTVELYPDHDGLHPYLDHDGLDPYLDHDELEVDTDAP